MNDQYHWDCTSLLSKMGIVTASEDKSVVVSGLNMNSQYVKKGDLFLAIQGATRHGAFFAQEAIERGAIALACDAADRGIKKTDAFLNKLESLVPIYWVDNLKNNLGQLAAMFFGYPSQKISVTGITGTNGKSTCMHFIAALFHSLGVECGVSGTLGSGVYPNIATTGMTTPDVVNMHRYLAGLRDAGVTKAVIEVSSHALEQGRVHGVEFDAAIFTNLSHDHLDYHVTMQHYFQAKKNLFTDYSPRVSIVNQDDPYAVQLLESIQGCSIGYSMGKKKVSEDDILGYVRSCSLKGSLCDLSYQGEKFSVEVPFFAEFFISNLLASLALLVSQGINLRDLVKHIDSLDAPVGRLQCIVNQDNHPKVWIDYAHTPSALEHVLIALRKVCEGSIWCVFGCGGDRDKAKRPLMGSIVEQYADRAIITSDNPRNEQPEKIISHIAKGFSEADQYQIILERKEAIQFAVAHAKEGDFILIAGKGHELGQELGAGEIISLNEREIIIEALKDRK